MLQCVQKCSFCCYNRSKKLFQNIYVLLIDFCENVEYHCRNFRFNEDFADNRIGISIYSARTSTA